MMKWNIQFFGGRSSSSGMNASSAGGSSFMSNQKNMEDYAIATGMFDRDYLQTAEGKEALREFMDDEIEAGLTEQEMRQAIRDTGSSSDRGSGNGSSGSTGIGTGGGAFKVSEVPTRIQSFTSTGTGLSGDWESKTYVTKKGDAIKEVTTYEDGYKRTETVAKNYPETNKTRAQFEGDLANIAKARIRTGTRVTAIDDKKKGR